MDRLSVYYVLLSLLCRLLISADLYDRLCKELSGFRLCLELLLFLDPFSLGFFSSSLCQCTLELFLEELFVICRRICSLCSSFYCL